MASAEAEVSDRLAAAEDVLAGLQEQERQRLLWLLQILDLLAAFLVCAQRSFIVDVL